MKMNKRIEEIKQVELIIPGLKNSYRFIQISDSHLVLCDDRDSKRHQEIANWRVDTFKHREITSTERFDAIIEMIHKDPEKYDGVLFTGDIIDFPTKANIEYMKNAISGLPIPYVYTLGNHDWSYLDIDEYHSEYSKNELRPQFAEFTCGNTAVHKKKIGEICFIAVDNGEDIYEADTLRQFSELISGEENVIVLQHAPLYSEELHQPTEAKWHKDLCLGEKALNKDGSAEAFRKMITADGSPVKAVICGHLHFGHLDMLDGKVPQYVSSLSAFGFHTEYFIHG